MGSNPTIYWRVVSVASYYIYLKIKRIKVAKCGTQKKIFQKIFVIPWVLGIPDT
jgi:hypothetical protein